MGNSPLSAPELASGRASDPREWFYATLEARSMLRALPMSLWRVCLMEPEMRVTVGWVYVLPIEVPATVCRGTSAFHRNGLGRLLLTLGLAFFRLDRFTFR